MLDSCKFWTVSKLLNWIKLCVLSFPLSLRWYINLIFRTFEGGLFQDFHGVERSSIFSAILMDQKHLKNTKNTYNIVAMDLGGFLFSWFCMTERKKKAQSVNRSEWKTTMNETNWRFSRSYWRKQESDDTTWWLSGQFTTQWHAILMFLIS